MASNKFKKLPAEILKSAHPQQIFERVTMAICDLIEDGPLQPDFGKLKRLPKDWQTVYWLWWFQCEAGVASIEKLCLDSPGDYLPHMHAALKAVDSRELMEGFEAGIAIAREEGPAEFTVLPDQSWYEQFARSRKYATLHAIDRELRPAVKLLRSHVGLFIKENAASFFEEE